MILTLLAQALTDSATGAQYPNAVWYPAQVTMDNIARQGSISWYAYNSESDFGAGKSPVGQHSTHVDTPAFLQGAATAPTQTTIQGVVTTDIAIAFGKSIPDTPTGATNSDGTPVLAPFFADATTVQVTV